MRLALTVCVFSFGLLLGVLLSAQIKSLLSSLISLYTRLTSASVLSSASVLLSSTIKTHNASAIVYPDWVQDAGYYLVHQDGSWQSRYLTPESFYQTILSGLTVKTLPNQSAMVRDSKGHFMAGMKRTTIRNAQGKFVKVPVLPTREWSYSDASSVYYVHMAHSASFLSQIWSALTRTPLSERITLEPVSALAN